MTKLQAAKMLLRYKAEMLKEIDEDLQSIIEENRYDEYNKELIYELIDHCLEGTVQLEGIIDDAAEWTYNSGIGNQMSKIRFDVELIETYLNWAKRRNK